MLLQPPRKKIQIADWSLPFVESKYRFNVAHGGRASGKSTFFGKNLIIKAHQNHQIILCAREHLNSLANSVHRLLTRCIHEMGLSNDFIIYKNEIIHKYYESRFFYIGLSKNIDNVRSIDGVNHCWIEEGDVISNDSWTVLEPTIRDNNSQFWITMNPKNTDDCLYKQFVLDPNPEDALVKKVNWTENPFFNDVMENTRKRALKRDYDMYRHVWEGEPLQHSDALVFKGKWVVDEFTEDPNAYAYYGLDFGFIDPTAAIRCYITGNVLYITHEYYKRQIEINNIGKECEESILGFKRALVIADSSAPGNISYLKNQGYNVKGAIKGKGSIEDGIAFLRSFDRIVIHPRCEYTRKEFSLYSYKVDQRSGDVTPIIIDAENHLIDALRYSVERIMKKDTMDYKALNQW